METAFLNTLAVLRSELISNVKADSPEDMDCVPFGRRNDLFFDLLVNRGLLGTHEASAHIDALILVKS